MRIDQQVAAIESETDRLLHEIQGTLRRQNLRAFRALGNRQFEDVGKVYERRGGPFTKEFLKTKDRDSKRADERRELQVLSSVFDVVQRSNLDIHMKAFIIRKLPLILSQSKGG